MTFMDKTRQALASVKTVLKSSAKCMKTMLKRQVAVIRRDFMCVVQKCLERFPKYRRRVLLKQVSELTDNINNLTSEITAVTRKLKRIPKRSYLLHAQMQFLERYLEKSNAADKAIRKETRRVLKTIPVEAYHIQFA